jgi:hypothetical protein
MLMFRENVEFYAPSEDLLITGEMMDALVNDCMCCPGQWDDLDFEYAE